MSFQTTSAQNQPLSYKLWFITANDNGCSTNNFEALHYYEVVTDQYLTKYGIVHNSLPSKCVTLTAVQDNKQQFEDAMNTVDLPIVVFDLTVGFDNLAVKNIGGLYDWGNGKQFILICACSPFVESNFGGWILSHELSHFALHYKGYPYNIFVNWVHSIQSQYYTCGSNDNNCPNLWTTIVAPSGKLVHMMRIFDPTTDSAPQYSVSLSEISPTSSQDSTQMPSSSSTPTMSSSSNPQQNPNYLTCSSLDLSGKHNESVTCYQQILSTASPDSIDYKSAISGIALAYQNLHDYNNAILYFSKALVYNPNDENTLAGLCYSYLGKSDFTNAENYGKQALTINPNDIGASICYDSAIHKVPEFGSFSGLVIAILISGVVLISRRFRFH